MDTYPLCTDYQHFNAISESFKWNANWCFEKQMHNKLSSSRSTVVRYSHPAPHVFVNCNIQHGQDEFCFKIEVRFTTVAFAGLLLFLVVH